jgi:hypothetical protein
VDGTAGLGRDPATVGVVADGVESSAAVSARRPDRVAVDGAAKRSPRNTQAERRPRSTAATRPQQATATKLVEMALKRYHLGQSIEGEAFAIPKSGPPIVSLLRTGKPSLRSELASLFYAAQGAVAGQQHLTDALTTLEGQAQGTEARRLWQRVAKQDGVNYLDLGDPSGNAVRIGEGGWTVGPAPVLFRRTALTSALPHPERGGNLQELWDWVNVKVEDRPLLLAYLVAALEPDIPHPVLGLFGEQGTGKSSTMRALVSYLDPSPVPYRKPPRDEAAWIVSAAGSWIVALDNLRAVPDWFSDLLCRAVTGEGDVRRRLFTDAELHTFAFRRVVMVSGIDVGNLNGDLADRLLPIALERFDEDGRREETELWATFERQHARVLGAILDLAAGALSRLSAVQLRHRPRMLDFARVVAAVDEQLGTDGFARYLDTQTRIAADVVTTEPVTIRLADVVREPFEGTAAELLALLHDETDRGRRSASWPRSARTMTQMLRRLAPTLRKVGWGVYDDSGANKQGTVRWTLVPPSEARLIDPPDPPDPPDQPPVHHVEPDADSLQGDDLGPQHGDAPSAPSGRSRRRGRNSAGQAGQAGQDDVPPLKIRRTCTRTLRRLADERLGSPRAALCKGAGGGHRRSAVVGHHGTN